MTTTGRDTREHREDDEPAYRYAREMLERPEYRGRSWTAIEPELRREWEQQYRDRPWVRYSEPIRNAWESMTNRGSDEADRRRFDEEHGNDV